MRTVKAALSLYETRFETTYFTLEPHILILRRNVQLKANFALENFNLKKRGLHLNPIPYYIGSLLLGLKYQRIL